MNQFDPLDDGDGLDRGLRAAFGRDSHDTLATLGGQVLESLESRLGFRSRVLLRDDPDEGRVVRPASGDEAAIGAGGAIGRRYQVHGEIARGGIGVVLKGRDTDLGRDVAMKVLQKRHASNAVIVQRFVEEAQIAGQLQHPGIPAVYELGLQADAQPFFTMKLVKGRTLAALLTERRTPKDGRARLLAVFEDVCQTIAYAHTRGVIHRDLKPSNIMVGAFGEVQVVDWGLAKVLGQGGAHDDRAGVSADETSITTVRTQEPGSHSVAGSVMGTPAYMSPEQARGEIDRLDERTDVFALGAILCEVLTARTPFCGDSALEDAAEGRLDETIATIRDCGADEPLIELAVRCLAPSPRERPASALAVAEAVREYRATVERRAEDAKVAAAEAAALALHERHARRLTIGIAALFVLVAVVVGAGYLAIQSERSARREQASERVRGAMTQARVLLGQAQIAPEGETAPWQRLADVQLVLDDSIEAAAPDVDAVLRDESLRLVDSIEEARRDHEIVQGIEELVIFGATHFDRRSWIGMERDLREAFGQYGLDLTPGLDDDHRAVIARQIRESPLRPQLTNGLELWIGTLFGLGQWGVHPRPMEEMMAWVELLYEADPDPYRSDVRRLLYSRDPSELPAELERLSRGSDFDAALPRTRSWLASIYWRTGDIEGGFDVLYRTLDDHPSDLMLNFDCGFYCLQLGRWDEAARFFHRCLVLRPRSGGIWRSLAQALRELGDLRGALQALEKSIGCQSDHVPTHLDRADLLNELGDHEAAIDACRRALVIDPDSAAAHCRVGRLLQAQGRLAEALVALKRGHELGSAQTWWDEPSADWVSECERLIEEQRGDAATLPPRKEN